MCWNPVYALLMLTSTFITYLCGIFIDSIRNSKSGDTSRKNIEKTIVIAGLCINLLILFFFKYFNFFNESFQYVWNSLGMSWKMNNFDLILPVGISFYTFHALGYIIDVFRGDYKPEKNFIKYALFVSFFPLLVAGPIVRASQLLPQFYEAHKFDIQRVWSGLLLILWGIFQKLMIADRLSILVNTVYNDVNHYQGFQFVIATVFFSFQILCDFSAYTDIAKGASQIMGINLIDNFNKPYFATSIKEFWRRWHISLSTWFKDYLYFPLGGSRNGKIQTYRNIMVVFLVSGLWHGANLTFLIWGGLHGFYQVLAMISKKYTNIIIDKLQIIRQGFSLKIFNILTTFILVNLAWIFFRANNFNDALFIYKNLFVTNFEVLFTENLYKMGLDIFEFRISLLLIVLLIGVNFIQTKISIRQFIMNLWLPIQWAICILSILSILVYGIYGNNYDASQFIYFQF